MNLEIDKTYMTKNGRFVKINSEPWKGIYNGEYEDDGRQPSSDRWKVMFILSIVSFFWYGKTQKFKV